ncbi:hypothetical protein LCGC14_1527850, partial [marine sediment metagenome]
MRFSKLIKYFLIMTMFIMLIISPAIISVGNTS